MMKVSDPIMFGHCVRVYFKDVFAKYADTFAKLGVDVNNGLGDVYAKIAKLPDAEKQAIEADIMATYEKRGPVAMVDGGRGITNLHVPSDIIIDNSMPSAIRDGGKMWNTADKQVDFLATIPDRGYGCTFDEVVTFCQKNGAFDPKTMGGCPNVGLMAQKAEEYGSHPNTFEVKQTGTVRIVDKIWQGPCGTEACKGRYLPCMPDQRRTHQGLGQARSCTCPSQQLPWP
jgi:isocitrate dehydrogenase